MTESMGKRKPRPLRSFTRDFKAEIVGLFRRGDRSADQVAKDFDLTETAARGWIRRAEVDTGQWDDPDAVAATLSSRPRKTLGRRTPAEAFTEHPCSLTGGVATIP